VLSTLKARQLGRYAPPRDGESKEDKFKAKEEQVVGARCLVLPTTPSGGGGQAKGSGFMGTPMLSLPPPIVPASSDSSSSGFEAMERRGTIRFVGGTHFGAGKEDGHVGGGGDWIGVELDEPVGKNDGR
jgi:tubulin-folding cofactor B